MAIGAADTVLLDVRSPSEYADEHIGGAINIPAPDLRQRARTGQAGLYHLQYPEIAPSLAASIYRPERVPFRPASPAG